MSQIQIWLAQHTAKFKDGFISAENASPVAGLDLPLSLMWKRVVYDADPSLISCMEYFTWCRELLCEKFCIVPQTIRFWRRELCNIKKRSQISKTITRAQMSWWCAFTAGELVVEIAQGQSPCRCRMSLSMLDDDIWKRCRYAWADLGGGVFGCPDARPL